MDDHFTNIVHKLLGFLEPFAAKGCFMVGQKLCAADFWIGGMYVNWMDNENVGFGKSHWAACKTKFP